MPFRIKIIKFFPKNIALINLRTVLNTSSRIQEVSSAVFPTDPGIRRRIGKVYDIPSS